MQDSLAGSPWKPFQTRLSGHFVINLAHTSVFTVTTPKFPFQEVRQRLISVNPLFLFYYSQIALILTIIL